MSQEDLAHQGAEDVSVEEDAVCRFVLSAEEAGERLDKVLARRLPRFSRSRIQQWIKAGAVTANDAPVHVRQHVSGDEAIVVWLAPSAEEVAYRPEPVALSVVHEDEDILVLDKPAGLVVHPAAGNWSGTLLNGLLHHYPAQAGLPRAGVVHRLDKDTSGLMVVARTLQAQTSLVRQLRDRQVTREYQALVWGIPPPEKAISAAIGRHPRDRVRMAVREEARGAKAAVTHYVRLATGKLGSAAVSLLRCKLETGRTHQIRVHMQFIGFPLVGDNLYGRVPLSSWFHRQALHARRLALVHPGNGRDIEWAAPLPDDMAGILQQAGIGQVS
ncbi:MAG: RluA family pseudouridine synthase [Burkholderiaceae bacterium]|jgi:23S rRNA pseudouridine1911/1915/1917 synthase|nr:RluA family pseudouridine synthase [Burkholderiaceae bacterium]